MTGRTSGRSATPATADGRRLIPPAGGSAGISRNPDVRAAHVQQLLKDLRRRQRRRLLRWAFYVLAGLLIGRWLGKLLQEAGLL